MEETNPMQYIIKAEAERIFITHVKGIIILKINNQEIEVPFEIKSDELVDEDWEIDVPEDDEEEAKDYHFRK